MQTCRRTAARVAALQYPDHRTFLDSLPRPYQRSDRLVGGAQAAPMLERHQWPSCEHSREHHDTRSSGDDPLSGGAR